MQTQSSSKFVCKPSTNPISTNLKRRNRRSSKPRVAPFSLEETPVDTMADQRTMAELLRTPTEGYAEAIVVPPISAEHFKLTYSLINLVTSKQFFDFEKEDPHAHIRYFNKITSTLKYKDVPETSIKLMLFPFSIDGPARIWLDKEPSRSIFTWEDLVSKFINNFFPLLKITNLRNEISNFQKTFEESFREAWDRFKDLLRACPHHGFIELHQLDTFYNGLNPSYQDSLNSAAGGNLLERSAHDVLKIIENKLKVCNSRNKPIVSQVKASNVNSSEIVSVVTSAMTAMFKQHQCPATDGNTFSGYQHNIQEYVLAATINYNQGNTRFRPQNTTSTSGSRSLSSNTIANPRGYLKAITTRSGVSYDEPPIHSPFSSLPKVVKRVPEVTKDTVQPSTKNIQPSVVQTQVPINEPVVAPNPKSTIPCPSRVTKQKLREKDDNLALKFVKVFRKLQIDLSFADDLFHMPKFALIPFLRTGRALIDVYGKELTLRVDDETITFKVGQTYKYSYNDAKSINQIDVINVAYEEYVQEKSRLSYEPQMKLPNLDDDYYDTEGDILYLEKLLNEDPSPNLPPGKTKYLKQVNATITKPLIEEPPKLELKEIPSHLEYAFLEGTNKLPVIISKELKYEEKSALLKVLKSHKRAIVWKISDIKGIDPYFCTQKILMEDDFKPAVQHQRRVNPKIHEVIEKEVIKLLDAELIYLISDSPWVSLVHCVPKKGGMTVIETKDNELIPTRLLTGWRVCIDYRKPNDATRKDHFPLPFMDQMLEHKMLKKCEDTNLVLNWKKCYFMVKEGIVLGHKISKYGIEVDRAKVDVISKLPHLTSVKEKLKTRWTGPFTIAQVFLYGTVELSQNDKINFKDTSENTKFAKQPIVENLPKVSETNALSKQVTSNSVSSPQESKGMNNDKVISPGMFRINPNKTFREAKKVPNTVSASNRTKSITVSQPPVITKKDVNSDLNSLSSIGIDNTMTRRLQPRRNTKHDRVPSVSKSSRSKNNEAEVEEHHRNLLLSKNNKHISSACNNIKIDSQDVISKVVCAMCKKCLISVNHDKCLRNYVNGKNSCGKKQKAKVSFKENQIKYQPKVTKPKKVDSHKSLATPKPRKSRFLLRWSSTGRLFDQEGKIVDSSESVSQSDCVNGDNACTSNSLEPKIKRFPNSTSLLDRLFIFVYGVSIRVVPSI
nr:reverse transcriptase domain-containing protein [Tanacetum cinerariifolium]